MRWFKPKRDYLLFDIFKGCAPNEYKLYYGSRPESYGQHRHNVWTPEVSNAYHYSRREAKEMCIILDCSMERNKSNK